MDEYLTLTEAARLLGISRWSLYRRVDEGALRVYASPANRRVKLVKRADLARLMTPQPIEPEKEKAAAEKSPRRPRASRE